MQRVIQVAEKAKIELSFDQETLVSIPYLHHFADGSNYHFQKKLTRSQLESSTMEFIDRTLELIKKSLDDINVKPEQIERTVLVGGQSRMPLIFQKLTQFFGKPPDIQINPEEAVAQGAALQAEIIKGRVRDLLLLDVTPLSLGVETKGDNFTKIIERNSTIPTKKSMVFTTITDNQSTVKIHVLQGERSTASGNKSLGFFNLVGIPQSLRGIPQIDVTFEIDANGIVRVSAQDKATGLSQSMKIQPASGLSPEEIERIVQDAKKYEEQDKARPAPGQGQAAAEGGMGHRQVLLPALHRKTDPARQRRDRFADQPQRKGYGGQRPGPAGDPFEKNEKLPRDDQQPS